MFLRVLRSLVLVVLVAEAHAQGGLAPFTTGTGRLMLFDHGRFLELDRNAPQALFQNNDRVAFVTATGDLRLVRDGRVQVLDARPGAVVKASDHLLAWKSGGSLLVPRDAGAKVLADSAGDFTVHDSLVVFHDRGLQSLRVLWHDRLIDLAEMTADADAPQWAAGSNTVTFYDRGRNRVSLFHRGEVQVLYDSTSMALVSAGGDLVAYWDDHDGVFRVWDRGARQDLAPLRPQRFAAGDGVVAWVTNGGAFKVYRDGDVATLLDHAPTEFRVHDSLVVFVDGGNLMAQRSGPAEVVEHYVPEQWQVEGGTLTYLDLDRGIRQWTQGERWVLASGMATKRFELWGDVVVWTAPDGLVHCWWRGKRYSFGPAQP